MDASHLDAIARSLGQASSRRALLHRARLALGLLVLLPSIGAAKGKKKRKKKLVLNEFGCVDVGKACRGNDAICCSGICEGKKPKKGKKDKRRCIAHNAGGCQADQDSCAGNGQPCGLGGVCLRTTGNASFCGRSVAGICAFCTKDADCVDEFGPRSACIVCAACDDEGGTGCFAAGDIEE